MSFSVTPFGVVKAAANVRPWHHSILNQQGLREGNILLDAQGKGYYPHGAPVGDLVEIARDDGRKTWQEDASGWFDANSPKAKSPEVQALLAGLKKLNNIDLAAYKQLVGNKPVAGFEDVDKDMRNWVKETSKAARCWEGYEPVPGKKPYSKGSCRPKGTKKKTTEKKAENFNLGGVASGAGPQQMYHALNMLNQARVLVDPTETLKKNNLSRSAFESTIKELANKPGDSYDFDAMRRDPKRRAVLMGLLGSALGGAAGYSRSGIGGALGGAALGGLGGAGFGHVNATNYNRKLLGTAKVLKNYGLLQPEYLRAALPLLQKTSAAANTAAYTKQALMWGGGKLGLHPKGLGVGGEIGYSNLLGLLPIPLGGVDIGGPRKGFLMGVTPDPESEFGVSPYLGVRWNHPRASGLTRNFPRGLPEVIYDKLRGRTKLDAMRLSYPELFEAEEEEAPEEVKPEPKQKEKAAAFNKLQLLLTKRAEGGAWTRAEGKSESGGLNAKGRASLKAQGQNIKPPVTESNPTGERKDRKKSFCARMGGMKKKLTSSETANDPDSRINKALRKWKC